MNTTNTTNRMIKSDDLAPFIDSEWNPMEVSKSPELQKVIASDEFQSSLKSMLEEFDKIIPSEYDEFGRSYVSMAEKNQLLEKHFSFGTFYITNQFINKDSDNVICYATLNVLTDDGYEPLFSRMGMGDPANVTTDGLMADAETSARRRIMIALGLGYEGMEEIAEGESKRRNQVINEYLVEHGNLPLSTLLKEYKDGYSRYDLPALSKTSISLIEDKKSGQEVRLDFSKLPSDDVERLVSFINAKRNKES